MFNEWLNILNPEAFIIPFDSSLMVPISPAKNVRKAIERSMQWFKYFATSLQSQKRELFLSIPVSSQACLSDYLKRLKIEDLCLVKGINLSFSSEENINEEIRNFIQENSSKLFLQSGLISPNCVLELLRAGVKCFDSR